MAIRVHSLAEPIPGYKLIERLGGGGFGEVWKAEAPGGLLKAIKFVHGTLHGAANDSGLVEQELKSLNRVKSVRHPYILSLERYDIVDGQLMIVMELADRNLWDRFEECKKQGLPGIPREELLRYMEEAAEALDLMNVQYQLQHLDIKPQNLFLVHNHVKVADFGLVKDLEGINTQVTSGVTPVYAAPETFDGVVSRYCDQYNLAIVYQELLTRARPFNGTNVRQLLMQHLTGTPDLSKLPPADRPIIARALSKKPEDRFPSCMDLVQALRSAGQAAVATPSPPPPETVRSEPTPRPVVASIADAPDIEETPAIARARPTAHGTPPPPAAPALTMAASQLSPAAPPLSPAAPPVSLSRAAINAERRAVAPPVREEVTGNGVLFPAVVIGVGGVGLQVLRQLRRSLNERCGPPEVLPNLRLLYMDSDPEVLPEATRGDNDLALAEGEVLLTRLNKPSHYLKPGRNRAALDSWLNMGLLCRVPRNQVTTEGLRVLGRLALADNYRPFCTRLRSDLDACGSTKALTAADRQTKLGLRTNRPRVYVVASLGGGTGSGMFLDVAYIARQQLMKLGYAKPDVVGVLLLPPVDRNAKKSVGVGNAFAALTELYHFSVPETTYTCFFDDSEEPITDKEAPFNRCVVLPLPEEGKDPAPLREAAALAGDFLCRDLVTPVGRKADELREEVTSGPEATEGFTCATFNSYRYSMPRRVLREQVSRALVRRLVQSWLAQDRALLQTNVRTRLAEYWDKLTLEPEAIISALKVDCERSLDRPPEAQFEEVLGRCFVKGGEVQPATALGALSQLEAMVGRPALDATGNATRIGEALQHASRALRRDGEQRLADFLSGLVEEPQYRVIGAEEAGQQLNAFLSEALTTHMTLYQDLTARAADTHTHIHALLCNLQKGSWWPGRKAKTAQELRESMEAYPKTRYQCLILQSLLDVLQGLLDALPKRLEEVAFCRQRLTEVQKLLDARAPAGRRVAVDLGPGKHFLPAGSRTVEDAIDTLLKNVKQEDLVELDQKVQAGVRRQFKSMIGALLSHGDVAPELLAAIQQHVETFVDGLLGKASVAALYIKERPKDADIEADVLAAFEEAAPKLAGPRHSGPELRLLSVPADLAGERLGKVARAAVDEVAVVAAGIDDVFFYRELPQLPLADLPQLGLLAEEAYRAMTTSGHLTPHTRVDVLEWLQAT